MAVKRYMAWMLSGTAAQQLMQFAVMLYLARLLSPNDFGVFTICVIVYGICKLVAEIGISSAVVYTDKLTDVDISSVFIFQLAFGSSISLILYFNSTTVGLLFGQDNFGVYLETIAIAVFFTSLGSVSLAILNRDMRFKAISLTNVFSFLFGYTLISISMSRADFGAYSLICGMLAQVAIQSFVSLALTARKLGMSFFDMSSVKRLLPYGIRHTLAEFSNLGASHGDNFVLAKYVSLESLGSYSRAYQIISAPAMLIGGTMDKVYFPIISRLKDKPKEVASLYMNGIILISWFSIPFGMVLHFNSEYIINILLGSGWEQVAPVLSILSLIFLYRVGYKINDSVLRSMGNMTSRIFAQLFYAFCILLGAYVGSRNGLEGVAVGVSVAIFLNFYVLYFCIDKSIRTEIGMASYTFKCGVYYVISYLMLDYLMVEFGEISNFVMMFALWVMLIVVHLLLSFTVPHFMQRERDLYKRCYLYITKSY